MLLREGDALLVDQARMLDAGDAGLDRTLDGLGAVRVCRHLPAPHLRFIHQRVEFGLRVLRGADRFLLGEDAGPGGHLDQVGAELDVRADALANGLDAVDRTAQPLEVQIGREAAQVAVATGGGESHRGDEHARSDEVTGVDRVAQRNVEVLTGADVAYRGEAGLDGTPGVGRGAHGRIEHRAPEEPVVVRGATRREVGVHVDESREQRGLAQVDDGRAGGDGEVASDLRDAVAGDEHDGILGEAARGRVEEARGPDRRPLRRPRVGARLRGQR